MSTKEKMDVIKSSLYSQGAIDERKLFGFAMAKKLPSGGYGLVAIGIKGDKFIIFDAKPSSAGGEVTDVLFEIPMNEIEDFKTGKTYLIIDYMSFNWNGGEFRLENYGKCKVDQAIKDFLS